MRRMRKEDESVHEYHYTVRFEPAEEGGYTVTCSALPGLVMEGDTLAEARRMAIDAIQGYLKSFVKDGLPFPREDPRPRREIIEETVAIAIEAV